MRNYNYSFIKVFRNYWFLFVLPMISGVAVSKIDFTGISKQELIWIIIGSLSPIAVLSIPLIAIFILLKTNIQLNSEGIAQKNFLIYKKIRWEEVVSIKKVRKYTISFDEPKDIKITGRDGTTIIVYGFLKDLEEAEKDIKKYSRKEF